MDKKKYQQYKDKNEYLECAKKKDYLMSYKKACKRAENLKEQLESLQETKESIKSQRISDMPKRGNRQQDLSSLLARLEDLQPQIVDAMTESNRIKLEIEEALWKLKDAEEARVLRFRYIYFMTGKEISKAMSYSPRQIWRIHDNAIKNLKMAHHGTVDYDNI